MIRKSAVFDVANGGGHESLHAESIVVPESFFMDRKKCVDLMDSAMSEHFKPDSAGRAWFRNPELSESKLKKRTKPFSAMLASVFIQDQRWVTLVQSHYENLVDDGSEAPIVTQGMMRDFFLNIEGMRSIAFDLVRTNFSYLPKRVDSCNFMQMQPAFAHARLKKGDAYRKRNQRVCDKEVRLSIETGFRLMMLSGRN